MTDTEVRLSADDRLMALTHQIRLTKNRKTRLQGDKKRSVAWIDAQVKECDRELTDMLRAAQELLNEMGRKKVATPYGELQIDDSVETLLGDEVVEWAEKSAPHLLKKTVTVAAIEKAGGKWTKDGQLTFNGEIVPGAKRTLTPVATLSSPAALATFEDED